jgi:hypothetical protein
MLLWLFCLRKIQLSALFFVSNQAFAASPVMMDGWCTMLSRFRLFFWRFLLG